MADAYLKVKDNGAQGLALTRETAEEAQSSLGVTAIQNDLGRNDWREIPFAIEDRDVLINYNTGATGSSSISKPTVFIDVHTYEKIRYKQQGTTGSSTSAGAAFYDQNKIFIAGSGIRGKYSQPENGYVAELKEAEVPDGAYYARFTTYGDLETYGEFAIYGVIHAAKTLDALTDFDNRLEAALSVTTDGVWTERTIITTSQDIGETISVQPTSSSGYASAIIPCKIGDAFIVSAQGGTGARTWAFTDTDYKLLSHAESYAKLDNVVLRAFSDGYLIVNCNNNFAGRKLKKSTIINGTDIAESVAAGKYAVKEIPTGIQYLLGGDVIPFKQLSGLFNGLDQSLKFGEFYNKFHTLYTTYADSNPGFEEINLSAQFSETMPAYMSAIEGAAIYMWHIPPLPKNDDQGVGTYNTMKLFITSGIHGSEHNSIVIVYNFMERLLSGSDEIAQMFRNLDIYILPLCNPYGLENKTPYNGNEININRDFPVANWRPETSDKSPADAPNSQYETHVIIDAINRIKPHTLIDHHCWSGNVVEETSKIYWGTSAFGITVSKMCEIFSQLNWQVKQAFPEKFAQHNFIYGQSRFVSATSGTLSRYSGELGINGATVEAPHMLKWSEEQGYIWTAQDEPQTELVSTASMYFINVLRMMTQVSAYALNSGIAFEVGA